MKVTELNADTMCYENNCISPAKVFIDLGDGRGIFLCLHHVEQLKNF